MKAFDLSFVELQEELLDSTDLNSFLNKLIDSLKLDNSKSVFFLLKNFESHLWSPGEKQGFGFSGERSNLIWSNSLEGFCDQATEDKGLFNGQGFAVPGKKDASFFVWIKARELGKDESLLLRSLIPVICLKLPNLSIGYQNNLNSSGTHSILEDLVDDSRSFICLLEGNRIRFMSRNCKSLTGYEASELAEKINDNFSLVHPEDLPSLRLRIQLERAKREPYGHHVYRIKVKDGSYRWFEWFVKRRFNKEGEFLYSILTCNDVHERVESEHWSREQREFLEKVLDALPLEVFLKDKDGRYLFVNEAISQSYGREKGRILGKTDTQIFPDDIAKGNQNIDRKVWSGSEHSEEEKILKSEKGNKHFLQSRTLVNTGRKGKKALLGLSVDITERIRSQEDAKEKAELVNRITELLPDSVFVFDLDTNSYVYYNYRLFEIMDYSAAVFSSEEKEKGKPNAYLSDVFSEKEYRRYRDELEDLRLGKKELFESEYEIKDSQGKSTWILSRKIPFRRNESGNVTQFIGLTTDITEQKRREQELITARSDSEKAAKAKDEFFSVMSHEIRTPLNAIIGISNLLNSGQKEPLEDKELLGTLKFSADNLMLLINDILDFSKIQVGQLSIQNTEVDILKLFQNASRTFEPEFLNKGLTFDVELDSSLGWVKSDPGRISQILYNLLSNALKFTVSGKVSLNASIVERAEVSMLVFNVEDSGIGIPEEQQEKIFLPFYQTNQEASRTTGGTGLGLAITKHLVDIQGGSLELYSKLGSGSKFNISVPVEEIEAQERVRGKELKTQSALNAKVLYVEDVASNQILMKGYSKLFGFDLKVASSGRDSLSLLEKSNFDLILMDIQMPELDGFETTALIKQNPEWKDIPIVAITADISPKTQERIKESGMKGVISKPFDPAQLQMEISKFSQHAGTAGSNINLKDIASLFSGDKKAYQEFLNELRLEVFNGIKTLEELNSEKIDSGKSLKMVLHTLRGALGNLVNEDFKELLSRKKGQEILREEVPPIKAELLDHLKLFKQELELRQDFKAQI